MKISFVVTIKNNFEMLEIINTMLSHSIDRLKHAVENKNKIIQKIYFLS